MRTFTCPARYRAYVEAALAIALADIGRDVKWRADDDEYVRRLAPIAETMIDQTEPGMLVVMVGIPNAGIDSEALPTHLHALTANAR